MRFAFESSSLKKGQRSSLNFHVAIKPSELMDAVSTAPIFKMFQDNSGNWDQTNHDNRNESRGDVHDFIRLTHGRSHGSLQ